MRIKNVKKIHVFKKLKHKAIDNVPESVLVDILSYLKEIQVSPIDKLDLSRHLGLILREDKELLQRLAL
jgi:hypothetical protein